MKAIYTLFKDDIDSPALELKESQGEYSAEFKAELDKRVESYKNGTETVSPEEMSKRIEAIRKSAIKWPTS